jgi:hypothetical protein
MTDELREKALETFFRIEADCDRVNNTISSDHSSYDLSTRFTPRTNILKGIREEILRVIGEYPPLPEIFEHARHGPGSSLEIPYRAATAQRKFYQLPYTVTEEALPLAMDMIARDDRWFAGLQSKYPFLKPRYIHKNLPARGAVEYSREREILNRYMRLKRYSGLIFQIVPGNRVTFVPKDCTKLRTIAIEPLLNCFMQLGVDGVIRRRLKQVHVDLDDQERNQRFAMIGSRDSGADEAFATIDLSNASDSVSLELVRAVLPQPWLYVLEKLRCPKGQISKQTEAHLYSKFSSMGNGATFVLESLIFYGILAFANRAYAGGLYPRRRDFAVYGDDIIVREPLFEKVKHLLKVLGFEVNTDKSFNGNNPFRESCGKDFYFGSNVRPLFIKKIPTKLGELFGLINRIGRYVEEHGCKAMESLGVFMVNYLDPMECSCFRGPPFEGPSEQYIEFKSFAYISGDTYAKIVQRPKELPTAEEDQELAFISHRFESDLCWGDDGTFKRYHKLPFGSRQSAGAEVLSSSAFARGAWQRRSHWWLVDITRAIERCGSYYPTLMYERVDQRSRVVELPSTRARERWDVERHSSFHNEEGRREREQRYGLRTEKVLRTYRTVPQSNPPIVETIAGPNGPWLSGKTLSQAIKEALCRVPTPVTIEIVEIILDEDLSTSLWCKIQVEGVSNLLPLYCIAVDGKTDSVTTSLD